MNRRKLTFLQQEALGQGGRAEKENAMRWQRRYLDRRFAIAPAGGFVSPWLQTFKEFPPQQKPGSINLDRVMEAVTRGDAWRGRQMASGPPARG